MKISSVATLVLTALLSITDAELDDGSLSSERHLLRGAEINERGLLSVRKFRTSLYCSKEKKKIRICFRTDEYPSENTVRIIRNERGIEGFKMEGFGEKRKRYCEDDLLCPGEVSVACSEIFALCLFILPLTTFHCSTRSCIYRQHSILPLLMTPMATAWMEAHCNSTTKAVAIGFSSKIPA